MPATTPMAGPKTPTARKAPSNMTPSRSRSSQGSPATGKKRNSSQDSPANGKKRKIKNEVISPKHATPKSKNVGASALVAQMAPEKKQKVDHEAEMTDYGVLAYPAFEGQYNQHPLTPLDTPSHSPQPPFHNNQQQQLYLAPQAGTNGTNPQLNNAANAGMAQFDQLIIAVSKKFPTLFPASTSTPVTSTHIDAIAYKVWGVCLNAGQGELLSRANQYGAMLSEIKLRAAARLNYLPSWCFLRERVVLWLQTTGKVVDDSAGMMQWKEATDEATKIIARAMRARFQTHAQAQASGLPIQMSGSPVQTSGIPMQDEAEERSGHF